MVSAQVAQCGTWRNLFALLNPRPPAANGNDVAALELEGWCLWCNSGDGAETTPNLFMRASAKTPQSSQDTVLM